MKMEKVPSAVWQLVVNIQALLGSFGTKLGAMLSGMMTASSMVKEGQIMTGPVA